MSTLQELEHAIAQLPVNEQMQLIRSVESRLRRRPASNESGEEWLKRINKLRDGIRFTPQAVVDSVTILNEMREDP